MLCPQNRSKVFYGQTRILDCLNDTYGHTAGDNYIKGCCKVICQIYKHSPVFRIGGDEFKITRTATSA